MNNLLLPSNILLLLARSFTKTYCYDIIKSKTGFVCHAGYAGI